MIDCTQCGTPNRDNARECHSCGASLARGRRGKTEPTRWSGNDGYCSFEHNGKRCPFPAVITDSCIGSGVWDCLYHHNPANRMHDAEQDRFFERFDPRTEHGRECIRDMLDEWRKGELNREGLVDRLVARNPQWQRQDNEGRSEYNKRMFAHFKTGMAKLTRREQEQQQERELEQRTSVEERHEQDMARLREQGFDVGEAYKVGS